MSTYEEVQKKMGIDELFALVTKGVHKDWKPTLEQRRFYLSLEENAPESESYEKAYYNFMAMEYALYEEWGIKRTLGMRSVNSLGNVILYRYYDRIRDFNHLKSLLDF